MDQILDFLLTQTLIYGYPIVVGVIWLGATGIPMPASAVLLAAGSFSVGRDGLNIYLLIAIATLAAVIGDIVGYYVGNRFGVVMVDRFMGKFGLGKDKIIEVDNFLSRWGIMAVFFTRWLLTPLCVPISLMAGIRKYSISNFIVFVFLGELLWSVLYVYLGFLFGASWQDLLGYINNVPLIFALGIIGMIILVSNLKKILLERK